MRPPIESTEEIDDGPVAWLYLLSNFLLGLSVPLVIASGAELLVRMLLGL